MRVSSPCLMCKRKYFLRLLMMTRLRLGVPVSLRGFAEPRRVKLPLASFFVLRSSVAPRAGLLLCVGLTASLLLTLPLFAHPGFISIATSFWHVLLTCLPKVPQYRVSLPVFLTRNLSSFISIATSFWHVLLTCLPKVPQYRVSLPVFLTRNLSS